MPDPLLDEALRRAVKDVQQPVRVQQEQQRPVPWDVTNTSVAVHPANITTTGEDGSPVVQPVKLLQVFTSDVELRCALPLAAAVSLAKRLVEGIEGVRVVDNNPKSNLVVPKSGLVIPK